MATREAFQAALQTCHQYVGAFEAQARAQAERLDVLDRAVAARQAEVDALARQRDEWAGRLAAEIQSAAEIRIARLAEAEAEIQHTIAEKRAKAEAAFEAQIERYSRAINAKRAELEALKATDPAPA
jgi:hypothetical protein